MSKFTVRAEFVPLEGCEGRLSIQASRFGLSMAVFSQCPHILFPLCMSISVSKFPFCEDTNRSESGSTLTTSSSLYLQ